MPDWSREIRVIERLGGSGLPRLQKKVQFDFKASKYETLKETNRKDIQKPLQDKGYLPPMS